MERRGPWPVRTTRDAVTNHVFKFSLGDAETLGCKAAGTTCNGRTWSGTYVVYGRVTRFPAMTDRAREVGESLNNIAIGCVFLGSDDLDGGLSVINALAGCGKARLTVDEAMIPTIRQ